MTLPLPLPVPEPNADSRAYWSAAREGRLLIRRCKACATPHFMPRSQCPQCWSDDLEWIESRGQGTVHTYSVVHRAPTPDFGAHTPYVVAMVDLDDGPRMFANVIGADALDVGIGDRVSVVFEERADGAKLPQFERVGAAA